MIWHFRTGKLESLVGLPLQNSELLVIDPENRFIWQMNFTLV